MYYRYAIICLCLDILICMVSINELMAFVVKIRQDYDLHKIWRKWHKKEYILMNVSLYMFFVTTLLNTEILSSRYFIVSEVIGQYIVVEG